jgi:hypothetical protein
MHNIWGEGQNKMIFEIMPTPATDIYFAALAA